MVSAHPHWEDLDDGYRNGAVSVFVEPRCGRDTPGLASDARSSGSEPEARSEAESGGDTYAVSVGQDLGADSESRDRLVDFADPRTAWECAHLVTHYVEASVDPMAAVSELLGDSFLTDDSCTLDGVVSDTSAEDAIRTMLGHNAFRLDRALGRISTDG